MQATIGGSKNSCPLLDLLDSDRTQFSRGHSAEIQEADVV